MAWSVSYLFMSFITPLPWVKRTFIGEISNGNDANVKTEDEMKAEKVATFFNKDFFSHDMLEQTETIDE